MQPTEELYYKYAGVLTSVVNKYAYGCPKEVQDYVQDELFLQAQLVFCQACLSYDPNHPSGASFETWLRNQLKSITAIKNKAKHGPNLLKSCSTPLVQMQTIKDVVAKSRDEDDDKTDISDFTESWYLENYEQNLSNGTENMEFPEDMIPYIKALRGDSLRIFQDFCRRRFDLTPPNNLTRAKIRAREYLNPIRLYRRVYMHEGWTLDRVRNAWRGLRGIFRNYMTGKLPASICDPKFNPVPKKSRARKESRSSTWYFHFEERHGITYGLYRSLKNRGIIPPLDKKTDQYLDLSMYSAMAM